MSLLCTEGMYDILIEIVQQARQPIILLEAADDLETEQVLLSSVVICQTHFTNCDENGMHQFFYLRKNILA